MKRPFETNKSENRNVKEGMKKKVIVRSLLRITVATMFVCLYEFTHMCISLLGSLSYMNARDLGLTEAYLNRVECKETKRHYILTKEIEAYYI